MKRIDILKVLLCFIIVIVFAQPSLAAESDHDNEEYSYNTVFPEDYVPLKNPKVVYLTFDDGPAKYTPQIIEILKRYNVPATFFVVGSTEYTHYMKMIVENSHAIGLHCYSHKFEQIYKSREAFFEDMQKIDDIVFAETGVRSMIMRFPGGSSVTRGTSKSMMKQLAKDVQERGYQYFDWNCDSSDKKGVKTASGALAKIKASQKVAGDIVIVLMHDTEKITVEYLPGVIEYFMDHGYDFMPLSLSSPAIHHSW